jgi:hypothetical protein
LGLLSKSSLDIVYEKEIIQKGRATVLDASISLSDLEQTLHIELELERIVRVPVPVVLASDRVDWSRLGTEPLNRAQPTRSFVDGPVEGRRPDRSVDDVLVEERIVVVVKVEPSAHPVRQVD